jgi:hypothetical protein
MNTHASIWAARARRLRGIAADYTDPTFRALFLELAVSAERAAADADIAAIPSLQPQLRFAASAGFSSHFRPGRTECGATGG